MIFGQNFNIIIILKNKKRSCILNLNSAISLIRKENVRVLSFTYITTNDNFSIENVPIKINQSVNFTPPYLLSNPLSQNYIPCSLFLRAL